MIDLCGAQEVKGASGPAWVPVFQIQRAKLSHRPLGSPADRRGVRRRRKLWRPGSGTRNWPPDAAAVPAGRAGGRRGGGPDSGPHSGGNPGGVFQPSHPLAGHLKGGHPGPGSGGASRPASHGLRQSALLYHIPGPHSPSGGPVLLLRHRHGAKGSGTTYGGGPRLPGLQRLYGVLQLLRTAGAVV